MKNILIAGGSGFIGHALAAELESCGYNVQILSRKASSNAKDVQWNPHSHLFPIDQLKNIHILINLCGAGIADKRWTTLRKEELYSSRVDVTKSLFELGKQLPKLEQYISASGINAYGYDDGIQLHAEEETYGTDFVSQLVKDWENAADCFSEIVPVTKLRIALVFSKHGGALTKLRLPLKFGVKGIMGNGRQQISWVHIDDLTHLFRFVMENKLSGVYNTNAGNCSNSELMNQICATLKVRTWWSTIPSFVLKTLLGESSDLVLKGARASNEKIKKEGFAFKFDTLDKALQENRSIFL